MGHLFGSLDLTVVLDLGSTIPELSDVYHLVRKLWSPAVDGTFVFYVKVRKGALVKPKKGSK